MISRRRGTCPGLADPLPTGDGLLARLAVARAIPLDAFAALCASAQAHGNGIIEITSRGSIQVRGLTARSAPVFAEAAQALDIADPAAGRVLANPLAGLDPHEIFDVTGLVGRLRNLLIGSGLAAKLAPKVSVVVDGGGRLNLDAIPCDIRLNARRMSGEIQFRVTLASDGANEAPSGMIDAENAVDVILMWLEAIAQHGPTGRARDLLLNGAPAGGRCARTAAEPIGTHSLRDGSAAVGIGLPFGHSDAKTLRKLVDQAQGAGAASMRPAPGRVLLLIGLPPIECASVAAAAGRLGFITKPDDPRRRVVACAGAPACLAAEIPTRVLAPAVAAAMRLDGQTTTHVSGCAKGCAHPAPADLTIVGIGGKCGIVPNGRARDAPTEMVAVDELPQRIAQRAAMREPAHG